MVRPLTFAIAMLLPTVSLAADIRVIPGEDVQAAVDEAMPGDTVILESGTHSGTVQTVRDGEPDAPIVLRGEGGATLQASDRVVDVQHAHFRIEDLQIDAEFSENRVVRVGDGGAGFQLIRSIVQNARRHCIDIRNTSDVLIEDTLVHHCLNWDGGRADAHGISAQAVQGLTVRNTEIHTFTGDAIQIDPSRSAPGWDDVVIDGCTFWLAPVTDGSGGVPDGAVPGENAIDTKTLDEVTGNLTVVDTTAYGFRDGEIDNMAAFNIKETVDTTFDRVTVYDSEIAFRLRGGSGGGGTPGAIISLTNVLVYDVDTALRVESDIAAVIPVHHVTFGQGIGEHVDLVDGATADDLDPRNALVVGAVPAQLQSDSTVEASPADFADSANGDYAPDGAATWLDSGEDLGVLLDRRGATRPQGAGPEPGAFEFGEAPPGDMGFMPADDMGAENGGEDMGLAADAGSSGAAGSGSASGDDRLEEEDLRGEGCSCSAAPGVDGSVWLMAFGLLALLRRRS